MQARARATAREPYQPFIYGRILGNVLSSYKNGPYGDKSGSPHADGGTPGENPGYDEAEWGNPGDPMGPYKYVMHCSYTPLATHVASLSFPSQHPPLLYRTFSTYAAPNAKFELTTC